METFMKRLFIIGNGFDLYHGLSTGLNDFNHFMKENYRESYDFINNLIIDHNPLFNSNEWNKIEDELVCVTELDYYHMLYEAINSSETDMDRASYWSDIQYNADYFNRDLPEFKKHFDEWINNMNIKNYTPDKNINFKSDDMFLNFNYTNTLQLLYGINDNKILHIHGEINSEKVFGHNVYIDEPLPMSTLTQEDFDHGIEDDWRIEEAKAILNSIPTLFYKDSKLLIENNRSFFNSISHYSEIIFMGWALGEQDEIYMNQIVSNSHKATKFKVVFYSKDLTVKSKYQSFFNSYEIPENHIQFYTWEEIEKVFN